MGGAESPACISPDQEKQQRPDADRVQALNIRFISLYFQFMSL